MLTHARFKGVMNIKVYFLLTYLVVLTGCVTAVDRSAERNYKDLVGEKILINDAILCKNRPAAIKRGSEYDIEINWQKDLSKCIEGEKLLDIPAGTKVSVRSVADRRYSNLFVYQHWYLLGELQIENNSHQFYHFYGFGKVPSKPQWR